MHHRFDTCYPRSKERLEKLCRFITDPFHLGDCVENIFVMLAPNCEGGELRPPSDNLSNYYFAPKITGFSGPLKRRRTK